MMLKTKSKKKRPPRVLKESINPSTDFTVVEAYKTIRTNLMFALTKQGCKKIIVTSGLPKEGKSTSVTNLAITLAYTESKVLMIDCDMRKAYIHKLFKLKSIPGLADVLGGMVGLPEVIQKTKYPSLQVICAGTTPPNPAELLGSFAMEDVLSFLEKEYDYILLDTPPVNLVADTLVLSKLVDGVLMIARQGETTHPEFSKALSSLEFVKTKVLGVILNDVEIKNGYGYDKYKYSKYKKHYSDYYDYYSNSEAEEND